MDELLQQLQEGCVQMRKRWSGDCGEMSTVDEAATDNLLQKAAAEIVRLQKKIESLKNK
jgi:hypothetical protein